MSWTYQLKALEDFLCLADQCPRSCCEQWSIQLDAATLSKWKSLPDDEQEVIFANIEENDGDCFLGKKGNQCFAVNSEGLCSIQAKHGHDMIPLLCRDFPRMQRASPVVNIDSARLSCHAIAAKVYANESPEGLFEIEQQKEQYSDGTYVFIGALQELSEKILNEGRFSTAVRIIVLLKSFDRVNQLAHQDRFTLQIHKQTMKSVRQLLSNTKNKVAFLQRGQFEEETIEVWGHLYQSLMDAGVAPDMLADNVRDGFFAPVFNEIRQKLQTGEISEQAQQYIDRVTNHFFRVMLVNEGFPGNPIENEYYLALIKVVILYSILRLLLLAKAVSDNDVDIEQYALDITVELTRRLTESYSLGDILARDELMRDIETYIKLAAAI